MTISKIYQQYPVPPNLAQHMLMVAAVGSWLTDHFKNKKLVNQPVIIQALLLHDLANIIKFDLSKFVHFLGGGEDELQRLIIKQQQVIKKYGKNEHQAMLAMVAELSVKPAVIKILKTLTIAKVPQITKGQDFSLKIALYADYRVAPHGLVSLDERMDDLLVRYVGREKDYELARPAVMKKNRNLLKQIEAQISSKLDVSLDQLNVKIVETQLKVLKDYPINE